MALFFCSVLFRALLQYTLVGLPFNSCCCEFAPHRIESLISLLHAAIGLSLLAIGRSSRVRGCNLEGCR